MICSVSNAGAKSFLQLLDMVPHTVHRTGNLPCIGIERLAELHINVVDPIALPSKAIEHDGDPVQGRFDCLCLTR